MNRSVFSLLIISGLLLFLAGCAPHGRTSKTTYAENMVDPSRENISYLNLGEYLRRVPGVNVRKIGDTYLVNVRSNFRLSGSTEPLYVVNHIPMVSYDQAAAIVDPLEIDHVEVIKDVAASTDYGMRGANGVIIIHLKN